MSGENESSSPVVKADFTGRASSSVPATFSDPTPDDVRSFELIAGQNIDVGDVEYWNDGEKLCVKYVLDDPFEMSEAQLYVGLTQPNSNGNPGRFPDKETFDLPVTEYEFCIDLAAWGPKTTLYIAMHAVVGEETAWGGSWPDDGDPSWQHTWAKKWGGYMEMCLAPMPDLPSGTHSYKAYHYGTSSFWNVVFNNQALALPVGHFDEGGKRKYVGWCVDKTHTMYPNKDYWVTLYSTYDTSIPTGNGLPITTNGNWEFISYMINQRRLATAGGLYDVNWSNNANKAQFQNAVWYFSNNTPVVANSKAEEFALDAIANGDNYVPCQGEWYGIALFPDVSTNNNQIRAQFNVIEVDP